MAERPRRTALTALAAGLVVSAAQCAASAPERPARSNHRGQSVDVASVGGGLVVDIRSASGIGTGRVSVPAAGWPPRVRIRLHTRGLESLGLRCGETRLRVEVSSHGTFPVRSYQLGADGQQVLRPDDPLHVAVEAGGGAGGLSVPLREGYFQVEVPPAMLARGCTPLDMKWIDFHR